MTRIIDRTDPLLGEVEGLMIGLAIGEAPEVTGEIVSQHLATGGKRLRARLALAAVEALGADAREAVGWAAACELLHNATLVHDDIQDGDRLRRNEPTVWVRHGIAQGVNAGDLLFMLPFQAVDRVAHPPATRLALCLALAAQGGAVIRGQAAEVQLGGAENPSIEAYLHAIGGKTSALFELPVEGATLIAGLDEGVAADLKRPFKLMGLIFQLQDDVLDLYGEKGRDARGSDLREGKVSALVVEHLALHPEDRVWLQGLLRAPRDATPAADVDRAIEIFHDGGALTQVTRRIERLTIEAQADAALQAHPALRELLVELSALIVKPIAHVF